MHSAFKCNVSTIFMISTVVLLLILVWKIYIPPSYDVHDNGRKSTNVQVKETINSKKLTSKCRGIGGIKTYYKEPVVRTFGQNAWTLDNSICAGLESKKGKVNFKKIMLQSLLGDMPLYIHHPKKDGVSKLVINGNFEPYIFKTLLSLLKLDPEVSLLDIGSHIGVNALQAAKYGRNVIAIEATRQSAEHVCASAIEGNVQNKLTIVRNAISNVHVPMKFFLSPKGDFAGAFMDDNNKSDLRKLKLKWDGRDYYNFNNFTVVNSVMLDDLLQLPNICDFRKVLIKMDVEGSEHLALDGGTKFFEQVDVQGVLMEYRWHVTRYTKYVIINFFERFKFDPFDFRTGNLKKLDPRSMREHDVLWLPRSKTAVLEGMKVF